MCLLLSCPNNAIVLSLHLKTLEAQSGRVAPPE